MAKLDPKHPSGFVYLSGAIWLEHLAVLRRLQTQLYNRNDAFFRQSRNPVDPGVEALFYRTLQKGIARAEARLRADKKDLTGLYFLGTARGALAGYESTVKRAFFSSLQNGSEAVDLHKKLLKHHPDFHDALLSVGLYNYVVGTLPAPVKIIMLIGGVRGSKTTGLLQLEKTMKNGQYARDEAAVLLVVLYDREKRHQDALEILRALVQAYPQNSVFKLEMAGMMSKTGQIRESMSVYESLLADPAARDYMLDLIHFQYAEKLFELSSWQNAYRHFVIARRVSEKTPAGMITMSHLRSGQCLDAMGRSGEAALEYQFVLKQPDILGSHNLAKEYRRRPFNPISVQP